MTCSTILLNQDKLKDPSTIKREDLACKIYYVAQGKHNITNITYIYIYYIYIYNKLIINILFYY